jgi:hypothetical protein
MRWTTAIKHNTRLGAIRKALRQALTFRQLQFVHIIKIPRVVLISTDHFLFCPKDATEWEFSRSSSECSNCCDTSYDGWSPITTLSISRTIKEPLVSELTIPLASPLYHTGNNIFMKYNEVPLLNSPVRIRVRIGPPHSYACRKRRLNGAVLRMRPEKLRPRVTIKIPPCSKALSAEHNRPKFCSPSPV